MTKWVVELFKAIDEMDTEKFLTFLDENARFKFGNFPEAVGHEQIKKAVGDFFGTINGLQHSVKKTWDHSDTVICHGEATYTRKDGSALSVPFANIFGMNGGKVKDYQIYVDISQLLQKS